MFEQGMPVAPSLPTFDSNGRRHGWTNCKYIIK